MQQNNTTFMIFGVSNVSDTKTVNMYIISRLSKFYKQQQLTSVQTVELLQPTN